jgi:hypothetical protein
MRVPPASSTVDEADDAGAGNGRTWEQGALTARGGGHEPGLACRPWHPLGGEIVASRRGWRPGAVGRHNKDGGRSGQRDERPLSRTPRLALRGLALRGWHCAGWHCPAGTARLALRGLALRGWHCVTRSDRSESGRNPLGPWSARGWSASLSVARGPVGILRSLGTPGFLRGFRGPPERGELG